MSKSYKTSAKEIDDGAICSRQFEREKYRVLFIMKEPNGCDLPGTTLAECFLDHWSRPSSKLLALWARLLLNERTQPLSREECRVMSEQEAKGHLYRIAIVNLKKTAGGARSDDKELIEYLEKDTTACRKLCDQIKKLAGPLTGKAVIVLCFAGEGLQLAYKKYVQCCDEKLNAITLTMRHPTGADYEWWQRRLARLARKRRLARFS